jgi:hypothetical protein
MSNTSPITFTSVLKLETDESIAHRRKKEPEHHSTVRVSKRARQPVDASQFKQIILLLKPGLVEEEQPGVGRTLFSC